MKRTLAVSVLAAAMLLAGCQSVNTTSGGAVGVERKQYMFSMLSSQEVDQMYAQSYQQTLGEASTKGQLDKTSANAKRVQAIAKRLIAQAPTFRPDAAQWKWEVNLIKSDEMNANCGPGGKIFVYSALIDNLKLTDDELAAVMGHEIAHALREHGREAMSKAYGIEIAKQGAGALFGLGQDSLALADTVANYGMTLPNSRSNENEADLIGLELSARAGYNPNAAITLWNKMAKASEGSPPEFMSTHPASDSRIASLQAAIPKVMPLYQQAKKPTLDWVCRLRSLDPAAALHGLVHRHDRQDKKRRSRQSTNQRQRQFLRREIPRQNHRYVGNQHAQSGADNHQPQLRILRGQHHRGDLSLVTDFRQEECNQRGQERPELAGGTGFVIVEFVWHQGPQRSGAEARCEDPVQHRIREKTAKPGPHCACSRMVGQGRGDDAGDDWPRLAEASSENEREQLRLVADFGQGNDCGRNE